LVYEHPCLLKDFQIFLQRDGRLVHFDVERCFPQSKGDAMRIKTCVPEIQKFEAKVLEHIMGLPGTNTSHVE